MYVTYPGLIQIGILIVALRNLVETIPNPQQSWENVYAKVAMNEVP